MLAYRDDFDFRRYGVWVTGWRYLAGRAVFCKPLKPTHQEFLLYGDDVVRFTKFAVKQSAILHE